METYQAPKSPSPTPALKAIPKNNNEKGQKKILHGGKSIQNSPHAEHQKGINAPAALPAGVKTYASVVTTPPPPKPLVNTNYKTERKQHSANTINKHQNRPKPAESSRDFTNQINQQCLILKKQEKKNKDPVRWYLEVVNSINKLKPTKDESIVQNDKHYQSSFSPFYCRALDSLVNAALEYFDKTDSRYLNTYHILEAVCTVPNPIHLHPDIYRPESAIHTQLKQLLNSIISSELEYLRYRASYPDPRGTEPVRKKIKWLLDPEAPAVSCGFLTREQVNAYSEKIEHPEPSEVQSDTLPLSKALASNNLQEAENLVWQSQPVISGQIRMIGDILKCSLTDLAASFQATHNSSRELALFTALANFSQKHQRTINVYDSLKKDLIKIQSEVTQRLLTSIPPNSFIPKKIEETIEILIHYGVLNNSCIELWTRYIPGEKTPLTAKTQEYIQQASGKSVQKKKASLQPSKLTPEKVKQLIKEAFNAIDKTNQKITDYQNAALILKPIIPYEQKIKKLPNGNNLIRNLHSIKGIIVKELFDTISNIFLNEVGHKKFNYQHLTTVMAKHKQQCIENEKYKFLLWETHLNSWHMTVSKVWGKTILDLLKSESIFDDNIHDLLQLKAMVQDNLCPTTRKNLKKLLIKIFAEKSNPPPVSETPELTTLIAWGYMILSKTPQNHTEEKLDDNNLSQRMEQLRALISTDNTSLPVSGPANNPEEDKTCLHPTRLPLTDESKENNKITPASPIDSTHKNEEKCQSLNIIYPPPEQFRDNPNIVIPQEQTSSATLIGNTVTTINPQNTQQFTYWSQHQSLLNISTVNTVPLLPQVQTAHRETQTENSRNPCRGVQTETPKKNSEGTQTGNQKNTSPGTQANLNKKPETTSIKTQTDLKKTPGTTCKKKQTDHDNIPATTHWEPQPDPTVPSKPAEYQVTDPDPVLKGLRSTPQKPLLPKPEKTEQNIPTQTATDGVTTRETDSNKFIDVHQSLSGDSSPVTRETKGLSFNKTKLKKSVKRFSNTGLEISVDQLCSLLESNQNFCKKWRTQKPLDIGYVRQCFEKWQQLEPPSISASSTPGQSSLSDAPSRPEQPPLPLSTPATAVPKPLVAEQPDKQLIPLLQEIQKIKAKPGLKFGHILSTEICTNGARAKLISEIEALLVQAEQVDAISDENDNTQKNKQIISNGVNRLSYQLGKISFEEAINHIEKNNLSNDTPALIHQLETIKPMHRTKLTSAEFAELTLYRAAIQIFHKNQIPGAASCQSFVNAIECFLRNQGYHQVIGIDEQLDMNVAPGAPTAVVCWNVAELRSCYFTTFLHDVDSDAFRKAIQSGEQAGASPENDSIDQLNGERYLLLRTTPTGEEGHFVNLVRSKASGRFIVIDGQKENIYPVIHPEPDFTITDDADKDITQRNIYAFRTDLIPDSIFSEELKRSNALMQSSITAQKASLSTG